MPQYILSNYNVLIVDGVGDAETDAQIMTRALAKDPRFLNPDVPIWLTKQPI